MSQQAKAFFESLKTVVQTLAPGLENFGADVSAEFTRVNTQAAAELAGAIFNGHAFVPYGPGQATSQNNEFQQAMNTTPDLSEPSQEQQQNQGIER